MNSTNIWIIRNLQEALKEAKRSKEYFTSKKDFTRDRDLQFEAVFYMILDLPRRSIGIELEDVLETMNEMDGKERSATPSAFSQARAKIKSKLFEDLNDKLLKSYYRAKKKKLKRWRGFLLQAIDGSTADMLRTKKIRAEFGEQKNRHEVVVPQARLMCLYDVLNGFTIRSYIGKLSKGEGTVAKGWVDSLGDDSLTLYDRLFPSAVLLYLHAYHKKEYVMRCKLGFNGKVKEFVASKKKEKVDTWILTGENIKALKELGIRVKKGASFKVRLVRVKLKTGEEEVLITSLMDSKKYPHRIFKKLYFTRWGVETNYGFLKNTLQIELHSGRTVKSIYQDFYATILRANLQVLIQEDAEQEVKEKTRGRKWKYQINKNMAAGIMKRRLVKLLFSDDLKAFEKRYDGLKNKFVKYLCPIKPERSVPRNKRAQKLNGKYKPMRNYKRAV